jgi:hypothetical protein
MRIRGTVATVLALASLTAGACASAPERDVADGRAEMVLLGEPFETESGQLFLLRIQDEYRLIRCIPDGPIAGCYEDVYTVAGHDVDWNAWVDVESVPGLRVAFVSPTAIAVAQDEAPPEPSTAE